VRVVSKGGIFRQSIAITLGNFDGLHKGHMKLVSRLVEIASKTNMKSMVYVIDNDSSCKILTKRQQLDILDKAGVDYVLFRKLSDELKNMEAYVFLKHLKERFSVGRVVVGDDYRFGKNRRGDIASINKFFEVDVINRVDNVSSTTIRDMIREGNVASANRMLGREFSLEGRVVEGLKNGRKIFVKPYVKGKEKDKYIPKDYIPIPSDA
jgi:riboflavin kinase/FMN adenylyltransferase